MNGRIRRFLPSDFDPSTLTMTPLKNIETRMNTTPRKCLGFMTPNEAFAAGLT